MSRPTRSTCSPAPRSRSSKAAVAPWIDSSTIAPSRVTSLRTSFNSSWNPLRVSVMVMSTSLVSAPPPRFEAVAEAADRGDERGVGGVLLDLGPEPLDVDVEGLGVADVVRPPDPVDQRVTGEDSAGVGQEQLEQLELLERQGDVARAHHHLVTVGVEPHLTDLEHLGRRRRLVLVARRT